MPARGDEAGGEDHGRSCQEIAKEQESEHTAVAEEQVHAGQVAGALSKDH